MWKYHFTINRDNYLINYLIITLTNLIHNNMLSKKIKNQRSR